MAEGKEQYRLVLVEWVDSHGCATDWANMANVRPRVVTCHTAGFLVAETDECLVVVPHIAFGGSIIAEGQGCGDMTIPKAAVRRVAHLLIPDGREAAEGQGAPGPNDGPQDVVVADAD